MSLCLADVQVYEVCATAYAALTRPSATLSRKREKDKPKLLGRAKILVLLRRFRLSFSRLRERVAEGRVRAA